MLKAKLSEIEAQLRDAPERGRVADYIPELACVDPNRFGMAVCLADGSEYAIGEAGAPFSIQSISKVFSLALALGRYGEQVWSRVGREPSNYAFNSLVELEHQAGVPRNPLINAGAIVVADMLLAGRTPRTAVAELLQFLQMAAGCDDLRVNAAVAESEKRTGDRNWSIAYFLRSVGNLEHPCEETLDAYFHQCAIEMSCLDLARAGRIFAGIGAGPGLISKDYARKINALMMIGGHYDASGAFAFNVGVPGKSGVGGGILAVAPGTASIAVWSPGLNSFGNSHLGAWALRELSSAMGWSLFNPR